MHPARLCTTSEPLPPAWTPAAHLRLPVTVLSTPNPRGCTPQSYQADRPPYCQEVRVETCTCICICVCSRPSSTVLPTYFTVWWVRPKRHHRRARRQRQRPVQRHRLQRTQPGRCGRADRDRRPNLRCAAPVRPRLPSSSHIPQALGPSTAHASQAPRSTSPQLSTTMLRRAPGHHGGAAPGRLWTLRFVRWRRRDRCEQAVSRVRE